MARSSTSKLTPPRRVEPEPVRHQEIAPPPPPPTKRGDREFKKPVTMWFYKDAYRTLQRIAFDQETTAQAMLERALDLLFKAEGVTDMRASDEERRLKSLHVSKDK